MGQTNGTHGDFAHRHLRWKAVPAHMISVAAHLGVKPFGTTAPRYVTQHAIYFVVAWTDLDTTATGICVFVAGMIANCRFQICCFLCRWNPCDTFQGYSCVAPASSFMLWGKLFPEEPTRVPPSTIDANLSNTSVTASDESVEGSNTTCW